MVILDVAIVNVALPSIKSDLGFSATGLQWVITAYAIFFGGTLVLGGRLFGVPRGARAVCALAPDDDVRRRTRAHPCARDLRCRVGQRRGRRRPARRRDHIVSRL